MYEVQDMKPVTGGATRRGVSKYPFADMKPGKGFYAPLSKLGGLSSLASRLGQSTGRRFRVLRVDAERCQVVEVEAK